MSCRNCRGLNRNCHFWSDRFGCHSSIFQVSQYYHTSVKHFCRKNELNHVACFVTTMKKEREGPPPLYDVLSSGIHKSLESRIPHIRNWLSSIVLFFFVPQILAEFIFNGTILKDILIHLSLKPIFGLGVLLGKHPPCHFQSPDQLSHEHGDLGCILE